MNSRLYVVLAVLGLWMGGLVARLYHLQVVQHDHYAERAGNQQRREITLVPPRGTIYDARGRQLAVSIPAASAFLNPRLVEDPAALGPQIASIVNADRATLVKRIARDDVSFVWLARQLDEGQVDKLRALDVNGMDFARESRRSYPFGGLAASVLGFVGVDPKGLAGLELRYDDVVSGTAVTRPVLRDARYGRTVYEDFGLPDAERGDDLYLTLDSSLQHIAERELRATVNRFRAKAGSVVVMNPRNGAILAMASYPTFDPNEFGKSQAEHRANRTVQHAYEPGSTFKLMTAAAALETQAVDPLETFFCENGGVTFHGKRIRDHHPFGMLTFREVIAKSSNVGAIKLGVRVGADRLYDQIARFGFGRKTGVDLSGEAKGISHPVESWNKRDIAYISFGQGISVTPLQLTNAFAAIANGGTLYRPFIVSATGRDGELIPRESVPEVLGQPISEHTAGTLVRMMESVVEEGGTGTKAAIPGYRVAGKTGTAEKPAAGGYAAGKYVASFVGFAPSRNPAVVALVVIDEPQGALYHGGDVAAEPFSRIARHALMRLGVPRDDAPPSLEPPTIASLEGVERARSTRGGP